MKTCRLTIIVIFAFLFVSLQPVWAGDGVDNSYITEGANSINIVSSQGNNEVVFGPGDLSPFQGGSYYIVINNNAGPYSLGNVSDFAITYISSRMLSAYYDRIASAAFYYRVYEVGGTIPGFSSTPLTLSALSPNMDPGTCYGSRIPQTWQTPASLNVLAGLPIGDFCLEFYIQAELTDYGDEDYTPNCNLLDPNRLCDFGFEHPGRILSSRFNTTDPNKCNYEAILAGQAAPAKITFHNTVDLPLSWTAFSAERINNDVDLKWETAQEVNVDQFVVERSSDAGQWSAIGTVGAENNSFATQYRFTDPAAPRDKLLYRLRAVDLDQTFTFSKVVVVPGTANADFRLYPNPADSYTVLEVEEGSHIRIFGASGHLVMDDPNTSENIRVETFDWPAGVYAVVVVSPSGAILDRRMLLIEH